MHIQWHCQRTYCTELNIERVVFEDEALSAGNEEFLDFC